MKRMKEKQKELDWSLKMWEYVYNNVHNTFILPEQRSHTLRDGKLLLLEDICIISVRHRGKGESAHFCWERLEWISVNQEKEAEK